MAVSVTLSSGGSIIAWQTPSGISFQQFDADREPVGTVTDLAIGPTVWLSAEALADGGFSLVWDVSTTSQPTAQNFDANGLAVGSAHIDDTPPIAEIAFSSRAMAGTPGGIQSVASTTLPDGGYVVATVDRSGPLLTTTVQAYGADGFQKGAPYVYGSGLAIFSDPEVTPLADGGYIVSFIHVGSHISSLNLLRFSADGAFVANKSPVGFSGPGGAFHHVGSYTAAGLPSGGFVLCWTTSADDQLHSQEFDAAGEAVGPQNFLGVAGSDPIIDVFPDGDYVVTWTQASGTVHHAKLTATVQVPAATNDVIETSSGSYTLPIGPHDIRLTGSGQFIYGNAQDNVITTNDSASILDGGGGDDTLILGHGEYIMYGGSGADTFVYQYLPWSPLGFIVDFTLGTDRLDLSALLATAGYTGTDPVADGYISFEAAGFGATRVMFDPDGPGSGVPSPLGVATLTNISPVGLTWAQLFDPENNPPPAGQTLTANDSRDQILIGGAGDDIFYAGRNSVVMTGGGGADRYVFQHLPWNNTGHITDFDLGTDILDFSALFAAVGYTGSDPVADGYIRFENTGTGGMQIVFDADGPGDTPWSFLVTTLDFFPYGGLTWDSLSNPGAPPPPPPPPPTGQTLTGVDTPGQILTGGEGDDFFFAGRSSVVMTGNGGADHFVFHDLPWNGARITDFASGIDVLDLTILFDEAGYEGTDPIADGLLRFESDGAGGTNVQFDPDGSAPGNPWAFLIATLEGVQPGSIQPSDWLYV